jgi:hypothetical protein
MKRTQAKRELSQTNEDDLMELDREQSTRHGDKTYIQRSPTKRAALADVNARQTTELDKERTSDSTRAANRTKTRSTSSSVSPTKKPMMRIARVGLSRHSIGSSQVSSQQSGPSAPFKRPSKIDVPLNTTKQKAGGANAWKPKQKSKDVIVIDDSDEDTTEKTTAAPSRRTSPRKKMVPDLQQQQQPKSSKPTISSAAIDDADTSFDTSLDESILCDAVEQAEASQREIQQARKFVTSKPPPVAIVETNIGEDISFDMGSSDNEAINEAMEACGW